MAVLKVLIVDDNEDAANSLAMLVRLAGHDAFVAYEAKSGLNMAAIKLPDLIIHDIALPGMSGYEAARRLRRDHRFDAILLVAHTAHTSEADRALALEAGFDHHVRKPIDPGLMRELLDTLVVPGERDSKRLEQLLAGP